MKHNKKLIAFAALLLLGIASVRAQVFIPSEEEFEKGKRATKPTSGPIVPFQSSDIDLTQTPMPLVSGWMLLTALGDTNLLGKRKKESI